jgi:hypothetical protein
MYSDDAIVNGHISQSHIMQAIEIENGYGSANGGYPMVVEMDKQYEWSVKIMLIYDNFSRTQRRFESTAMNVVTDNRYSMNESASNYPVQQQHYPPTVATHINQQPLQSAPIIQQRAPIMTANSRSLLQLPSAVSSSSSSLHIDTTLPMTTTVLVQTDSIEYPQMQTQTDQIPLIETISIETQTDINVCCYRFIRVSGKCWENMQIY